MKCLDCCYYISHQDAEDLPDEDDGYCSAPAHKTDHHAEYGGHWCRSDRECECGYAEGKP